MPCNKTSWVELTITVKSQLKCFQGFLITKIKLTLASAACLHVCLNLKARKSHYNLFTKFLIFVFYGRKFFYTTKGTNIFRTTPEAINSQNDSCTSFVPTFKFWNFDNKGPFQRYGGHFEFYCFQIHIMGWEGSIYIHPKHPIIAIWNKRFKMAAGSPKRSIDYSLVCALNNSRNTNTYLHTYLYCCYLSGFLSSIQLKITNLN